MERLLVSLNATFDTPVFDSLSVLSETSVNKGSVRSTAKLGHNAQAVACLAWLASVHLAGVVAHINGEPNKGRETVVEFADAKAIRQGLGMSQAVFSCAYGIPLKTLQQWEQRRHNPDRTASAYLWTIEEFPDQVREALRRHPIQQPAEIE
jgi:putative transcriptional regulator